MITLETRRIAIAGAGVAVAVAAVYGCAVTRCRQPLPWGPAETLLWAAVGLVYIAVGLLLSQRHPQHRLGAWLTAAGFAWFLLPDDAFLRTSLARTWDVSLTYFFAMRDLYIPFVVASALALPTGRLHRRSLLVVVGLAAFYLLRNLAVMALWVPALFRWGDVDNLLLIRADPALLARLESFVYELDDPVLLVVVGVAVWRWWAASGPGRRVRLPLLWAAAPWAAAFALGVVDLWVDESSPSLDTAQEVLGRVGVLVLPLALLAATVQRQAAHARLGPLLRDLATPQPPGGLRARLAGAVGDPSLQVGFWSADAAGYVDHDGRPLEVPDPHQQRSVTLIDDTTSGSWRWCTTRRSTSNPTSWTLSGRRRGSRWRTKSSTPRCVPNSHRCGRRGRASSRPPTPRGVAWSATSTTAPNNAWSPCRWRCSSPATSSTTATTPR